MFFLDAEGEKKDKTALRSIKLDGSEPRTIATSADASDIAVSPDEQWLAFSELWNAYVMAFPVHWAGAGDRAESHQRSRCTG